MCHQSMVLPVLGEEARRFLPEKMEGNSSHENLCRVLLRQAGKRTLGTRSSLMCVGHCLMMPVAWLFCVPHHGRDGGHGLSNKLPYL